MNINPNTYVNTMCVTPHALHVTATGYLVAGRVVVHEAAHKLCDKVVIGDKAVGRVDPLQK